MRLCLCSYFVIFFIKFGFTQGAFEILSLVKSQPKENLFCSESINYSRWDEDEDLPIDKTITYEGEDIKLKIIGREVVTLINDTFSIVVYNGNVTEPKVVQRKVFNQDRSKLKYFESKGINPESRYLNQSVTISYDSLDRLYQIISTGGAFNVDSLPIITNVIYDENFVFPKLIYFQNQQSQLIRIDEEKKIKYSFELVITEELIDNIKMSLGTDSSHDQVMQTLKDMSLLKKDESYIEAISDGNYKETYYKEVKDSLEIVHIKVFNKLWQLLSMTKYENGEPQTEEYYSYDENGNILTKKSGSIENVNQYSQNGKPLIINNDSKQTIFKYIDGKLSNKIDVIDGYLLYYSEYK